MPKHFLTYDLSKTTAIDKEPKELTEEELMQTTGEIKS
jgi:hypothetical protein